MLTLENIQQHFEKFWKRFMRNYPDLVPEGLEVAYSAKQEKKTQVIKDFLEEETILIQNDILEEVFHRVRGVIIELDMNTKSSEIHESNRKLLDDLVKEKTTFWEKVNS